MDAGALERWKVAVAVALVVIVAAAAAVGVGAAMAVVDTMDAVVAGVGPGHAVDHWWMPMAGPGPSDKGRPWEVAVPHAPRWGRETLAGRLYLLTVFVLSCRPRKDPGSRRETLGYLFQGMRPQKPSFYSGGQGGHIISDY
jgi:hypothetical protein